MIRRSSFIICAGLLAFVMVSGPACFDPDEERPKPPTQTAPTYQDLTQKDHVLNNLWLSYNQQRFDKYAELLDEHFVYFFSDEDFSSGKTPEQWGREEDLACHEKMFNPNTPVHKVLSIKLSLAYPADQWISTTPDQGQFPGETWYYKSVSYDLTIVVEAQPQNITYMAQNLKALFTIRQVNKGGKMIWQIVEWRDDVKIAASSTENPEGIAATQETNWGQVKSLFGI